MKQADFRKPACPKQWSDLIVNPLSKIGQNKKLISRVRYRKQQSYAGIAVGFRGFVIIDATCRNW